MSKKPKIIYHGNRDRCRQIEDYARLQMDLLRKDMSFQGLEIGGRKRKTKQGELIECRSAHGEDILHITAPEPVVEEGVPDTIQFELWCSNGGPVTINMLSYLVLYDAAMYPVYVYDVTSDESAGITVGGENGNVFTVNTGQGSGEDQADLGGPFWAFYACHEDTEKWGGAQIVRNGIRTQWPFRYRTEYQFRNEDMVMPGNLYRDVIPYGCFKFDISGTNEDGETVTVTSGLDFEIFKESGESVNVGAGVDFVLSQYEEDANEHHIYNKKLIYPDKWPRYICEEDGKGFWIFILSGEGNSSGSGGSGSDNIPTTSRASRCDCEEMQEDPDDEEEPDSGSGNEGLYSHLSQVKKDGVLQYQGKCKAEEQGKKSDLIFPRAELRTDSLCEDQEAGTGQDYSNSRGRDNCGNWLCLSLMREYDMANVTPGMLTHFSVGPVGTGEYVDKDEYKEMTGNDPDSHFRQIDANSKGMAYGYGYDMNLEQNCWTVVLPGVSLDWDGQSVGLWLLGAMSEEEAEEYKDSIGDGDGPEPTQNMIWMPFSSIGGIYYNEATQDYEIFLGGHPAHAYRLMYNCSRGLLTMYPGICVGAGGDSTGGSAFVSPQGGNYFSDTIPSNTIELTVSCCGKTLGEDDSLGSKIYDENGKCLTSIYHDALSYNKKTGRWETTIGGARACPSTEGGVYLTASGGGCKGSLYGGDCDWEDVTEGELLKPGEYDFELCAGCPSCAHLTEINGYSLDEYQDNVMIDSGGSVTLTFEGCFGGSCQDFIDGLDDGLPDHKKGSFSGGGEGETFTVTYTASSNLCNEFDAGICPSICGYTILCCCGCDENNAPSLSKTDCDPDSHLAKYKVTPGCPPFTIMRRDQDNDGNWSEWASVLSLSGCDWKGKSVSACWFCQGCDREEIVDGCPEDRSFEIKVADSMDRESNVVSSDIKTNNELYDPPEPDPENPETVENEASVGVCVINGWGPFTWELMTTTDITMDEEETGRCNTFYAGPDACGPATARVTDDCGNTTTVSVRILNGEWTETTRQDCPISGPADSCDIHGCTLTKGKWRIHESDPTYCYGRGCSCNTPGGCLDWLREGEKEWISGGCYGGGAYGCDPEIGCGLKNPCINETAHPLVVYDLCDNGIAGGINRYCLQGRSVSEWTCPS